mgnify:CR=1 FL=1
MKVTKYNTYYKFKYYMKLIKFFEEFLNESKEQKYDYGCLMLCYDFPEIKDIQDKIEKDDIHDQGLVTNPHTTLLYGLHDREIEDDNKVLNTAIDKEIPELILYNISLFENDDYDVFKFDVKQKNVEKENVLYKINKELTDNFPFTNNFPDYHPHCTIGYLKKGKGVKYVKMLKSLEYKVKPNQIVYSKSNGDEIKLDIKKLTR